MSPPPRLSPKSPALRFHRHELAGLLIGTTLYYLTRGGEFNLGH